MASKKRPKNIPNKVWVCFSGDGDNYPTGVTRDATDAREWIEHAKDAGTGEKVLEYVRAPPKGTVLVRGGPKKKARR